MAAAMLGCDDGPGDIAASMYDNNSPSGHVAATDGASNHPPYDHVNAN